MTARACDIPSLYHASATAISVSPRYFTQWLYHGAVLIPAISWGVDVSPPPELDVLTLHSMSAWNTCVYASGNNYNFKFTALRGRWNNWNIYIRQSVSI